MKRTVQSKKIDKAAVRFVESRWLYVVLLILVWWYLFSEAKVLNKPRELFWLEFALALVGLSVLMLRRYMKFKHYYRRKFSDGIFCAFFVVAIIIFSFILQGVVSVPMNYYLITKAKNNPVHYLDCEITNVSTKRSDAIHFEFRERTYWRYFDLQGLTRTEILDDFKLVVRVRESCLGAYRVEEMKLVRK